MSIKIIRPGLLSTLQDLGRYGYQQYGVVVSGVMDSLSHRLANILVGNSQNEATMEITLLGPVLEFNKDTVFAICGADLGPTIDGVALPLWRPIYTRRGSKLIFKGSSRGCRAYLAIAGGFDIPKALGSKSTYIRAGIGGFRGRALQEGDELSFGKPSKLGSEMIKRLSQLSVEKSFANFEWGITPRILPNQSSTITIRAIAGKELGLFTEDSRRALFNTSFKITNQSDRMGFRLAGEKLSLREPFELISEAVAFGTVQVPADGNPIVLMADRQTTGGYPKVAQVISVDLPLLAQARPGDMVNFQVVSLSKAHELYLQREQEIKQLVLSISLQVRKEV